MNQYQITNGRELNQIMKLDQSLMTLMTGIKTRACPREVHGYSLTCFYGCKLSVESILHVSDVTKISSCRVNTTSRWGIKQLGISLGSIFLLFTYESSRGPRS